MHQYVLYLIFLHLLFLKQIVCDKSVISNDSVGITEEEYSVWPSVNTLTSKRNNLDTGNTQGCSINAGSLGEKQPIILNEKLEFFYPEAKDEIYVPKHGNLIASCIDNTDTELESQKTTFYNLTCIGEGKLYSQNKEIDFRNLKCKDKPEYKARYTKKKCGKSFQQIEIGFSLGTHFLRVLDICFDPVLQTTIYSHFHMKKLLSRAQDTGRIHWINDFFHLNGENVDRVYSKKYQKKQLNSLLELSPNSNEIVKDDNSHYLARGHLTAKADVYYAHQQRVTFFSVNAAPQWQSINNGNWKILENAIRKLTSERKLDLEIYTGTHEILELTSTKLKQKTKIFLFEKNDKESLLPVPLFFWKIVFDPIKCAGVAFVGVNNPYITRKELGSLQICESISERIRWVKFKDDLDTGYCYSCRLKEFLNVVKNAPRLNAKALLE